MLSICKLKNNSLVKNKQIIKNKEYLLYLEGKEIIEVAKQEAKRIVEEAKKLYEQEKERGYRDGLEEGKMQMAEQMMEMMTRSVNFFSSVEEKMVNIVMQAIEKILGEINEEELVIRVVKNALAAARGEKKVTVRVALDKVEIVKKKINEIIAQFPVISFIDVVPDQRVKGAGCILESEIGIIDANLDVQLKAIERALKKNF